METGRAGFVHPCWLGTWTDVVSDSSDHTAYIYW